MLDLAFDLRKNHFSRRYTIAIATSLLLKGIKFEFKHLIEAINYSLDDKILETMLSRIKQTNLNLNDPDKPVILLAYPGLIQLKMLINAGADPHITNLKGYTALMYFAHNQHAPAVRFLLSEECKADVNARSIDGLTALTEALTSGLNDTITPLLLAAGANIDIKDNSRNDVPLLTYAVNKPEILKQLIDLKANVNVVNEDKNTPLMLAIETFDKASIDVLLEHKADLKIKNKDGLTAFSYAIKAYLTQKTVLSKSQYFADDLRYMKPYQTLLRTLLELGADPNDRILQGSSALHAVLECERYDQAKPNIFDILLQCKEIKHDVPNQEGATPLMLAAKIPKTTYAYADAVSKLLDAKANTAAVDQQKRTALFYSSTAHNEATELLLKSKADPNHKDKNGNTPLITALNNIHLWTDNCVKVLLSHNANPLAENKKGENALTVLKNCGANSKISGPTLFRVKATIESEMRSAVKSNLISGVFSSSFKTNSRSTMV